MLDFRIYPPLVVKDTPKPRALGSLAEAGHFVERAMRLRRPPAWRNIYERLRAVGNKEEAIEVIGALRELLDLEDLLVFTAREALFAEPTEDAEPLKGAGGSGLQECGLCRSRPMRHRSAAASCAGYTSQIDV